MDPCFCKFVLFNSFKNLACKNCFVWFFVMMVAMILCEDGVLQPRHAEADAFMGKPPRPWRHDPGHDWHAERSLQDQIWHLSILKPRIAMSTLSLILISFDMQHVSWSSSSWPLLVFEYHCIAAAFATEEKRQAKRKRPRKYIEKQQNGGVHGCSDLSKTADYTASFARALFNIWHAAFAQSQGLWMAVQWIELDSAGYIWPLLSQKCTKFCQDGVPASCLLQMMRKVSYSHVQSDRIIEYSRIF